MRIPVGVAYSSDLKLAQDLMLQACEGQERVLDNPKPAVLLREFGESAVVLELRLWVAHPERGMAKVASGVQFRVWELFHENNIQFPFPQQDVHLKEPLRVQVDHLRPVPDEEG